MQSANVIHQQSSGSLGNWQGIAHWWPSLKSEQRSPLNVLEILIEHPDKGLPILSVTGNLNIRNQEHS